MKLAIFGTAPSKTRHLEKWVSGSGTLIGILTVVAISEYFAPGDGALIVAASMGATAVLVFAVPHGTLSQPWAVIGGHTLSAFVGVSCRMWVPHTWLAAAFAVAVATMAMQYFRCVHPPGGATALTAIVGGDSVSALGFNYVLAPIFLSALSIVIAAVIFNYVFPWRRYPALLARKEVPFNTADQSACDRPDNVISLDNSASPHDSSVLPQDSNYHETKKK